MGLFYPSSEELLMTRIQNVCGKSNSNLSNYNFGIGVIYDCFINSKTPFEGLAPINKARMY